MTIHSLSAHQYVDEELGEGFKRKNSFSEFPEVKTHAASTTEVIAGHFFKAKKLKEINIKHLSKH